jgi:hypothetical protein
MGYGLDTTTYNDRKWPTTITWSGEWTGKQGGKLREAMNAWQQAVGVTFTRLLVGTADFEIKWDTSNKWSNNSDGPKNGKPQPGTMGTLWLKSDKTLGSTMHEIGHLLGLSHEQDRPDARESWYENHDPVGFLERLNERPDYYCEYGSYDTDSIMHYSRTGVSDGYKTKSAPSQGDIAAVKAINGW